MMSFFFLRFREVKKVTQKKKNKIKLQISQNNQMIGLPSNNCWCSMRRDTEIVANLAINSRKIDSNPKSASC